MLFAVLPAADSDLFPYLLVNIGSGVSIVKVDGEGQYERISGSSVGGGTFWGLSRLLTGLHNFDDMLAMSAKGNNSNVRRCCSGSGGPFRSALPAA
jgi:type II pantothenate kinase